MKKILSMITVLLVIVSAFTISASAEGERVNYALNAQYTIDSGGTGAGKFLASTDGTTYYGDDLCEILNDGVNPYYNELEGYNNQEVPGYGVVLVGSGTVHTITFDLGAIYDDIDSIVFGNVWDSYNFGYEFSQEADKKGNRGFTDNKAMIRLSTDGVNFERTKDYNIVKENHTADGSENGFYNYNFKFNAPVKARALQLLIFSPVYCLSLSEIEIYGYGHAIEGSEIPVAPESSEEIVEESSETTGEVASEAVSEATSEVASEAVSDEAASENDNAESADIANSSEATGDEGGPNLGLIIGIVAAVVVVAAVVIIVISKKK
jgi:hypothetical protein